jgi:hypothetical protein
VASKVVEKATATNAVAIVVDVAEITVAKAVVVAEDAVAITVAVETEETTKSSKRNKAR